LRFSVLICRRTCYLTAWEAVGGLNLAAPLLVLFDCPK
jgi:hypothetical protein